jgi:hypothetical protein
MGAKPSRLKKRELRAPDRLLSHEERLALTASKQWIAGYPHLVAEWHPTKNVALYPYQLSHGSNEVVRWKCARGRDHEWLEKAADRVPRNGRQGRGCPLCALKRLSVTNTLRARFPKLARQWHPSRNGELRPADVIASDLRQAWWKCPRGTDHEWSETVRHRTRNETPCPFCAGFCLSITNCLATLRPDLAREWHPTKNGKLTPKDVRLHVRTLVWWRCPRGPDHEWRATIKTRVDGGKCPCCAGRKLSITNCFAAKHPELAAQWHPTRNRLRPERTFASAKSWVWWKCPAGPDHEWRTRLVKRVASGTGCPFCVGQAVSTANSLRTREPSVAAEWHPTRNSALSPEGVTVGSRRVVWWRCARAHEWEAPVCDRARRGARGCPSCGRRRASRDYNLETDRPDIAAEWHPTRNGGLTPLDVTPGSHRRLWWRCSKDRRHEWEQPVMTRTRGTGRRPFCAGRRSSTAPDPRGSALSPRASGLSR